MTRRNNKTHGHLSTINFPTWVTTTPCTTQTRSYWEDGKRVEVKCSVEPLTKVREKYGTNRLMMIPTWTLDLPKMQDVMEVIDA